MSETLYVSMEFDAKQMIRILGNDLYDSPLAMLRENVQNAYDAILERRQVDSAFEPVIKIDISDTQIIIEDNGIGMNDDILTNNYWKAGNSGKNNAQALAAGVVGHFGIGALANFGVCTKLEIQTHRYGEDKSFESEALRDKLNIKESIPIVTRNGNDIPVGTRVVATLECQGSINADSAINYLRQYIEYIEIPVYVNGMKFPKKTTSFERKISGLQITSSAYSYKLDIGYGNSFPLQVYIKAYDINSYGTRLKGYIYLNSSEKSLMGLRNGFGLSNINVLSEYDFGGVANLDCLVPTAGREAVSRESTQLVYSLLQSIEKTWTEVISKELICDKYGEFALNKSKDALNSLEDHDILPMPPIMCLDVDTKLRILKTDTMTPVLQNNQMFMALTDRMVKQKRIFFSAPHTTRIIWSMHRLIYIFTDACGKNTLYYDLELTRKIPNSTGGKTIRSTTIITKDKIFVPIVPDLYEYFNLNMDEKLKFYVHFDEVESM